MLNFQKTYRWRYAGFFSYITCIVLVLSVFSLTPVSTAANSEVRSDKEEVTTQHHGSNASLGLFDRSARYTLQSLKRTYSALHTVGTTATAPIENLVTASAVVFGKRLALIGDVITPDQTTYKSPRVSLSESSQESFFFEESSNKNTSENTTSTQNRVVAGTSSENQSEHLAQVSGNEQNATSTRSSVIDPLDPLFVSSLSSLTDLISSMITSRQARRDQYFANQELESGNEKIVTEEDLKNAVDRVNDISRRNDESVLDSIDSYSHPDEIELNSLTVGDNTISDFAGTNLSVSNGVLSASNTTAKPAGSDGQIQFNSSGSFGAVADFFWDNTNNRLGIGDSSPSASLFVGANGSDPRFRVESATSGTYALEVDENDEVSVGTGNGDIFLDTAGGTNVGIGTSSPTRQLHINSSSPVGATSTNPETDVLIEDTNDTLIEFMSSQNNSNQSGILFSDNTETAGYVNYLHGDGSGGDNELQLGAWHGISFQVEGATGRSKSERMRLTPEYLQLHNPSNSDEEFHIGPSDSGSSDTAIEMENSNNIFGLHAQDDNKFRITNDDESENWFTLDGSNGNIGFGTNSPNSPITVKNSPYTIEVSGNNNATSTLNLSEDVNDGFDIEYGGPTNRLEFNAIDGGANLTHMVIERSSGNVGIGTASPATLFEVAGTSTFNGDAISDFTGNNLFVSGGTLNASDDSESSASSSGAVQYSDGSGGFLADGNNFFWDNTNSQLGIGTSSPSYQLEVDTGSSNNDGIRVSGNSNPKMILEDTDGGWPGIRIDNNGTAEGKLEWHDGASAFTLASVNSGPIAFVTSDSSQNTGTTYEKMRLDSSGNLGIGTAVPASTLDIVNATDTQPVAVFNDDQTNELVRLTNDGNLGIGTSTPSSVLAASGTISQTNATGCALEANSDGNIICSTSDKTLKTNFGSIENPLDRLSQIEGQTYEFKDPDRFGNGEYVGFTAQDVEGVFPQLVRDTGEYKTLDYGHMTAVLTEAVKELDAKVSQASVDKGSSASSSDTFIKTVADAVGGFVEDGVAKFNTLFANRVETKELCVESTCINEKELKGLLDSQGGNQEVMDPRQGGSDDTNGSSSEEADESGGDKDGTNSDGTDSATSTPNNNDSGDTAGTSTSSSTQNQGGSEAEKEQGNDTESDGGQESGSESEEPEKNEEAQTETETDDSEESDSGASDGEDETKDNDDNNN